MRLRVRGPSEAMRRTGIGVADQAIYSIVNFGLTVVIARNSSRAEFGAYSVILATYLIVSATSRGLTSETYIVRYSTSNERRQRRGAGAAGGVALGFGLIFGSIIAVGGYFTLTGDLARLAIVMGAFLPALFFQDLMRYVAFGAARPEIAVANDITCAVVQTAITAWLLISGMANAVTLIIAWGIGAAVGGVLGAMMLGVYPRYTRLRYWFSRNGDLASSYATDDVANQGTQQASAYVIAAVAGLKETGALRGALTVFGPLAVAYLAIMAVVTPEMIRRLERVPRRLRRDANAIGLTTATGGLIWGVLALICPRHIGHALFGPTWDFAHPLIIYIAIAQVGGGFRIGYAAGLRALGAAKRTLRARAVVTVVGLATTTVAAAFAGATGAAVSLAIVTPLQSLVWWRQFVLAHQEYLVRLTDVAADQAPEPQVKLPAVAQASIRSVATDPARRGTHRK